MSQAKNQPETLDAAYEQVLQELLDLFIKKHQDYGKGNILSIKELGIAFRVGEKSERLKHLLMTQKDPSNESVEDTWLDIAVYAIIGILYRREQFQKLEVKKK
jgi:hypothetical protein